MWVCQFNYGCFENSWSLNNNSNNQDKITVVLRTCSFLTIQKSSSFWGLLSMFHRSTIRQPSLTKTDRQQRRKTCKMICMCTEGTAEVRPGLSWNVWTRFSLGVDRLVLPLWLEHKESVFSATAGGTAEVCWVRSAVSLFRRWYFSAF